MASIIIAKLKLRRGTEAQRAAITLEQGELGYITDRDRVIIGDGTTVGGILIGNKIHTILVNSNTRNTVNKAYRNDMVYENNWMYQLTGTDYSQLTAWSFVGTVPDNDTLEYNASRQMHIKADGIGLDELDNAIVYNNGALNFNSTYGLSANVDSSTIVVSASSLQVKDLGITEAKLADNAVTSSKLSTAAVLSGVTGGGGTPISVNVDDTSITIDSATNSLTVGQVSASQIIYGTGLTSVGSALQTDIAAVDGTSIKLSGGSIELETYFTAATGAKLANVQVNEHGIVTLMQKTVKRPLSGANPPALSGHSFAGYYSNTSAVANMGTYRASKGDGTATDTLSSAGFIIIDVGQSITGENIGTIAIPIYNIPSSLI